ncbi:MAG: ABC transporter permease subunit [Planctomycetota bacterium]|jgi:ABC-type transport system involved in multi-copper enzyme maturation permease subunit
MNPGILLRSVREAWLPAAVLAVALVIIEAILAYVLPTFLEGFSSQLLQLEFFRNILRALLGTDVGDFLTPTALSAIAWVHPAVLALVWTHAVVFCTRSPAGEIDRGTIDVLLGLPISRWSLYTSETSVFMVSGALMLVLAVCGHLLGSLIAATPPPPVGPLFIVVVNFYCLYLAVGGIASMISAASDRRGRAVAVVFAILIASFLLNFLATLWPVAERLAFLSVLQYYQPFFILADSGSGGWPLGDIAVLLGVAAVTWVGGGLWFARRDICTV